MMPIDVQQSANSVRMWLEMRIVLPIRRSSFKRAFTSIRARGSRPLAGSSRISTGRVVDQRLGQAEPLLHAARQAVDEGVALAGQVQQLQHVADDLPPPGAGNLVGHGEEVEKLPDLHAVVDAEVVGHVADAAADGQRVLADAVAVDDPVAAGGLQAAWPESGSSCSCPRRWGR